MKCTQCPFCGAPFVCDNGMWATACTCARERLDTAPSVPLSDERIQNIVTHATQSSEPLTHEEARWFHEGFLAGATAYAREIGHSTLKRDNPKLREVFEVQGWKTIELYEKIAHQCEHGVKEGDWCEPCNVEMKRASREDEAQ